MKTLLNTTEFLENILEAGKAIPTLVIISFILVTIIQKI